MKILITSGGTSEQIDKVRAITNISTGKLGAEIANTILKNTFDVEVYFLSSNRCEMPNLDNKLKIIEIKDTESVFNNMKTIIENNKIDFVIHAMAISDYKVDKVFNENNIKDILSQYIDTKDLNELTNKIVNEIQGVDNSKKISSNVDNLFIKLTKTPKIIDMIKQWDANIKLISFKLLNGVEEEELINVAKKQLDRTNSDLVIANDLVNIKNGNHRALFIQKDNYKVVENKINIANEIFNFIQKNSNLIPTRVVQNMI